MQLPEVNEIARNVGQDTMVDSEVHEERPASLESRPGRNSVANNQPRRITGKPIRFPGPSCGPIHHDNTKPTVNKFPDFSLRNNHPATTTVQMVVCNKQPPLPSKDPLPLHYKNSTTCSLIAATSQLADSQHSQSQKFTINHMLPENLITEYKLLESPENFREGLGDEMLGPGAKDDLLGEAMWSAGILSTPKKT